MHLGPFSSRVDKNQWYEIRVRGMHNSVREDITQLSHGQSGCIAFACKEIRDRKQKALLRNGIVAVSHADMMTATWCFTAEITVLNHATTITNRYQSVIHCLNVKQVATIILPPNVETVTTGPNTIIVGFRFAFRPEHIEVNSMFLFREGRTRGVGRILTTSEPHFMTDTTAVVASLSP